MYDYIIVGAGPSGLTLAWILSQYNKKILLIDREETIGGCHRVRRMNKDEIQGGYFSEHGPRIYNTNAFNFKQIYEEMGGNYDNSFVPYNFGISQIGGQSVSNMGIKEIFWLVMAYINLIINNGYGKNQSVEEYCKKHNFSTQSQDYMNRLCRLSDGAGSDRYTLYEFLQLLNQHFFYQVLQPNKANDVGFLKIWDKALKSTGLVDIMLNTEVINIKQENQRINSIEVKTGKETKSIGTKNTKYILAIPPTNLLKIMETSEIKNAFGNIQRFREWERMSKYITYVPITFHWMNNKQNIPKEWGFTKSDWGLVYIVLSDYMTYIEKGSKTVISTCFTIENKKSSYTGKTIQESSMEELREEAIRQLREAMPDLEPADKIIISSELYRNEEKNGWLTKDNAFIVSTKGYMKRNQSREYKNLYSLGTHNGHHYYDFTSIESAVSNAISLGNKLVPESKKRYKIKNIITLIDVVRIIKIIFIIMLIIFLYQRYLRT